LYLAEINSTHFSPSTRNSVSPGYTQERRFSDAAHKLVTSNLRFVVKVAYEYRSYGIKMADLIQEGNIGLMMAVQKFDAERGIRLISTRCGGSALHPELQSSRAGPLVKARDHPGQRKLFFFAGAHPARVGEVRRRDRRQSEGQRRRQSPRSCG